MSFRGHYFDGRTAKRQDVLVSREAGRLRITTPEGEILAVWPVDAIELIDTEAEDTPPRLRLKQDDGARLILDDPDIMAEVGAHVPHGTREKRGRRRLLTGFVVAIVAISLFIGALWVVLPAFARHTARAIPISWEQALGERVLEELMVLLSEWHGSEPATCDRAAGETALRGLVDRLATASESPYDFQVTVIDIEMTNAFALPGGTIVVFQGLIDFAETPDEVAAVLAHEMAHVIHRHGTESLIKITGLGLIFQGALGDWGRGIAGSVGETLIQLSFSREAEQEADAKGLALLQAADIRGDGLASFFRRLSEQQFELPAALSILSTHPNSEQRSQRAEAIGGAGSFAMVPEEWQALKEICAE